MKAESIMEQCEERQLYRLSNGSKCEWCADRASKLRFLHKVNTAKSRSTNDTREASTAKILDASSYSVCFKSQMLGQQEDRSVY